MLLRLKSRKIERVLKAQKTDKLKVLENPKAMETNRPEMAVAKLRKRAKPRTANSTKKQARTKAATNRKKRAKLASIPTCLSS